MIYELFLTLVKSVLRGMEMENRIEIISTPDRGEYLTVAGKNTGNKSVFSVRRLYEMYQAGNDDIKNVVGSAVCSLLAASSEVEETDVNFVLDRSKIVFELINTEWHRELLNSVPNRPFHDLSITYRCIVASGDNAEFSYQITNEFAERNGLTESDLFALAKVNTLRISPAQIIGINSFFISRGFPLVVSDEILTVITNKLGKLGSSVILYDEVLQSVAKKLGSNFYLLPSSKHECLAMLPDDADTDEVANMVRKVNLTKVDEKDRLSDSVYYYDKELRTLMVVA